MEITRGQTASIYANISEEQIPDLYDITSIWFTIKQGGLVRICKTMDDCYINGRKIYMDLSQAETLKFQKGTAGVQISVVLANGTRAVSQIHELTILPIQKEGIQND